MSTILVTVKVIDRLTTVREVSTWVGCEATAFVGMSYVIIKRTDGQTARSRDSFVGLQTARRFTKGGLRRR